MKRKLLAALLCAALLCASLAAVAEAPAFDIGHIEDSTYVNQTLGVAFSISDISGMGAYQTYAGADLDETNKVAWDDADAQVAALRDGEMLTCFVYADMDNHTAGKVNSVQIIARLASGDDPESALLEEGKATLESTVQEQGLNLAKAEIGDVEFAGATHRCLSVDVESGGRHQEMLYVAVQCGDYVYRITFNMDASAVANYMAHFSAL